MASQVRSVLQYLNGSDYIAGTVAFSVSQLHRSKVLSCQSAASVLLCQAMGIARDASSKFVQLFCDLVQGSIRSSQN